MLALLGLCALHGWASRKDEDLGQGGGHQVGDDLLLSQARVLHQQRRQQGPQADPSRSVLIQGLLELSRRCETTSARAALLRDASKQSAASGRLLPALMQCAAASRLVEGEERCELDLEVAHLERRLGKLRSAELSYLRLAAEPRLSPLKRDRARHWSARMAAEQGHWGVAEDRWMQLARGAFSTEERLSAYEQLIRVQVQRDRVLEAQRALEECSTQLSPYLEALTHQGDRLRSLFDKAMNRCKVCIHDALG